jgi:hypothetical protein
MLDINKIRADFPILSEVNGKPYWFILTTDLSQKTTSGD